MEIASDQIAKERRGRAAAQEKKKKKIQFVSDAQEPLLDPSRKLILIDNDCTVVLTSRENLLVLLLLIDVRQLFGLRGEKR